jgi:hypothetical protein
MISHFGDDVIGALSSEEGQIGREHPLLSPHRKLTKLVGPYIRHHVFRLQRLLYGVEHLFKWQKQLVLTI